MATAGAVAAEGDGSVKLQQKDRVNWFTATGYAPQQPDPSAAPSLLSQLQQLTQKEPRNAHHHNSLAMVLEQGGDAAGAEAAYREAIGCDATLADPHCNLGRLLAACHGQLKAAEQEFLEAVRLNPKLYQGYYNLAVLRERYLSDFDGAEQAYRDTLRCLPTLGPALHSLANLLVARAEVDEAEKLFRAACDSDKTNATYTYNLGMFLEQFRKNIPAAEECYRRAIALRPDHGPAYNNLGLLLKIHKKDFKGAEEAFRSAIKCSGRDVLAVSNLVVLLQAQNRLEEADVVLRDGLAKAPNDAILLVTLGQFLTAKKDHAGACEAFERALQFDTNNPEAHLGLGELYAAEDRDPEVALEHFRAAVAADAKMAAGWAALGFCLQKHRHDTDGAKKAWEQAIALNPHDRRVRHELELIYGSESRGFRGRCLVL